MADKIIFSLIDLKKYFGQVEVLKGITLSFLEGAKIGLIGPNGAGKTTCFYMIVGLVRADAGTLTVRVAACNVLSALRRPTRASRPAAVRARHRIWRRRC